MNHAARRAVLIAMSAILALLLVPTTAQASTPAAAYSATQTAQQQRDVVVAAARAKLDATTKVTSRTIALYKNRPANVARYKAARTARAAAAVAYNKARVALASARTHAKKAAAVAAYNKARAVLLAANANLKRTGAALVTKTQADKAAATAAAALAAYRAAVAAADAALNAAPPDGPMVPLGGDSGGGVSVGVNTGLKNPGTGVAPLTTANTFRIYYVMQCMKVVDGYWVTFKYEKPGERIPAMDQWPVYQIGNVYTWDLKSTSPYLQSVTVDGGKNWYDVNLDLTPFCPPALTSQAG